MNACISVIQHIRKLRGGAQFTASAGVRWCPLPLQVIEQSSILQSGPTLSKGRSSVFFCPLTDLGQEKNARLIFSARWTSVFTASPEDLLYNLKISDPVQAQRKGRFLIA